MRQEAVAFRAAADICQYDSYISWIQKLYVSVCVHTFLCASIFTNWYSLSVPLIIGFSRDVEASQRRIDFWTLLP